MATYMYVSASTKHHSFGKADTLGKVINTLMMANNGHVDVIQAVPATGSWNGVTENSVRLTVAGTDNEVYVLACRLAIALGQESIMVAKDKQGAGNADKITDKPYAPLSGSGWTQIDGMGQPRYAYSVNWDDSGDYDIHFVDANGYVSV